MSNEPADPGTPLAALTASLHELYLEFVKAGFSEAQALYLVGQQIRAMAGGNS
jgi:hypothetical protein